MLPARAAFASPPLNALLLFMCFVVLGHSRRITPRSKVAEAAEGHISFRHQSEFPTDDVINALASVFLAGDQIIALNSPQTLPHLARTPARPEVKTVGADVAILQRNARWQNPGQRMGRLDEQVVSAADDPIALPNQTMLGQDARLATSEGHASGKDIDYLDSVYSQVNGEDTGDTEKALEPLRASNDDKLLGFGMHRARTYADINQNEPQYCEWVLKTVSTSTRNAPEFEAFAEYVSHHRLLGFGKFSRRTYADVERNETGYCQWLLKGALTSGSQPADAIQQFVEYLQDAGYVLVKVDLTTYRHKMLRDLLRSSYTGGDRFKAAHVNASYWDIVTEYIAKNVDVDEDDWSFGWVALKYSHDRLGQRLVEEGILEGARRYAGSADPFSLPSTLNELLTDRFYVNVDDSKAHPTYMRLLTQIPEAQRIIDLLILQPQPTMQAVAQHYFKCSDDDAMGKVKVLFLRLGMDGKIASWRNDHAIPDSIPEHPIVSEYEAIMPNVTAEFSSLPGGQRAIEIIRQEFPERTHPERTWKSFLLQELEFESFRAKARIAQKYHGYGSVEHDGMKLLRGEKMRYVDKNSLEKELSDEATRHLRDFVFRKYSRDINDVNLPVKVKEASFYD